jgi:hypothetical protein
MVSVLREEGTMNVSSLGSKLPPKPTKDFRLGRYITQHPEVFDYNAATQMVTLKKK